MGELSILPLDIDSLFIYSLFALNTHTQTGMRNNIFIKLSHRDTSRSRLFYDLKHYRLDRAIHNLLSNLI